MCRNLCNNCFSGLYYWLFLICVLLLSASTGHAADVQINAKLLAYDTLCDLTVSPQLLETIVLKKDTSLKRVSCLEIQKQNEKPHAILISIINKSIKDIEIPFEGLQNIVLKRKDGQNVVPIAIALAGKSKKGDMYEAIFISELEGAWIVPVSKGTQVDLLAFFPEGLDGDFIKLGKYKAAMIKPYTKVIPYNAVGTKDTITKILDITLVEVNDAKITSRPNPYGDRELIGIIVEVACTAPSAEVVLNESSIYVRYRSGKLVTDTVLFNCANFNDVSPAMVFGGKSSIRKWDIKLGGKLYNSGSSIMNWPMVLEKGCTGLTFRLKQNNRIRVGLVLPAEPENIDVLSVLGIEFKLPTEGKE